MPDTIRVTIAMAIDERHVAQLAAIHPRLTVEQQPELGRLLRTDPTDANLAEARRLLAGTDILLGSGHMDRAWLEASPRLSWFHVFGAGLDRFADSRGLELPITVTNSSGIGAAPIAEWVVGAVILLAKGFPENVRNQSEHRWKRWQSTVLEGKTAGIVGFGAIGEAVAHRLRSFGMRIIATRRSARPGDTHPECDLLLPQSDLPRLLAESDFSILAVPLTPDTRHLVDAAALAHMRPTSHLINVARGEVVDQDALLAALREQRIAGAAVDVTDPEPLPADHPLWDERRLFISPHMSAIHPGYMDDAIGFFAQNLRRYVAGEKLINVVDPKRGY